MTENSNVLNTHELHRLMRAQKKTPADLAVDTSFDARTIKNALAALSVSERLHLALARALGVDPDQLVAHRRIALDYLPSPSQSTFLVGRNDVMNWLDNAWKGHGHPHAVQLVGDGGIGKSSIVWHWLQQKRKDGFRGVPQVIGWRFFSKDEYECLNDSRAFLELAMAHFADFGLSLSDEHRAHAYEVGRALAEAFIGVGGLMVLDGFETLQYPPKMNQANTGLVGDAVMSSFLRAYLTGTSHRRPRRLLIVTTRWKVPGLGPDETCEVGPLRPQDGAELLHRYRLEGSPTSRLYFSPSLPTRGRHGSLRSEMHNTSREFGGHPLALILLASLLLRYYRGNLAMRSLVLPFPEDIDDDVHRHARRVMDTYDELVFSADASHPTSRACRQLLCIVGLFDRPVPISLIWKLQHPPIAGLTDGLSTHLLQAAIDELRALHLITLAEPGEVLISTHPLIREHFAKRFKDTAEVRVAHARLCEHFSGSAPVRPNTSKEMEPLFRAVMHGCRAGQQAEVLDNIYFNRMYRKTGVTWKKLGLLNAELKALQGFCDIKWLPNKDLAPKDGAFVLVMAGFLMRCLGQTGAALPLFEEARRIYEVVLNDPKEAANASDNLSQCFFAIGDLCRSLEVAQEALRLADATTLDSSHHVQVRVVTRATTCHTLHQMGQLEQAEQMFHEAERIWTAIQTDVQVLCLGSGFRYCDLLLALGRHEEVVSRASQSLKYANDVGALLAIGLDNISLGRALMLREIETGERKFESAVTALDAALENIRKANMQEHLPLGLLARAEVSREMGDGTATQAFLGEALDLSDACGMGLNVADCYLAYARYHRCFGRRRLARQSLSRAVAAIDQCGYHRRRQEVAEMKDALHV